MNMQCVSRHKPKKSNKEFEEFGPGKKDIIICPNCSCVYYCKSWHHTATNYPHLNEDKKVIFKICPACNMKAQREWEGEIRIKDVPKERVDELMSIIIHCSKRAFEKDPMDRVLSVDSEKNNISVYTSENQLAIIIAKKLASALKKNFKKPIIHKGKNEDSFLITMSWLI